MKHNSVDSLLFGFAIRLKWFKNSLNLTIVYFFRFAIHKAISKSRDTESDKLKWR